MTVPGHANFGPLAELERDAVLLEDVVADAREAWDQVVKIDATPRSTMRMQAILGRLHAIADALQAIRLEQHDYLMRIEREKR